METNNNGGGLDKGSLYYKYNPIIQYVIRPTLKLVDAHNHPILGGIAASVSSGLAHYGTLEAVGQVSDYLFGTDFRDPQTKMILTNIPLAVHFFLLVNILSNLGIGVKKYYENKAQKEKNSTLDSII